MKEAVDELSTVNKVGNGMKTSIRRPIDLSNYKYCFTYLTQINLCSLLIDIRIPPNVALYDTCLYNDRVPVHIHHFRYTFDLFTI